MMPKSASATQSAFSFFSSSASKSRPGTSSGESIQQPPLQQLNGLNIQQAAVLTKDRKNSFPRKTSFSNSAAPPALPDFALAAAAKLSRETEAIAMTPGTGDNFSRILGRTAPTSAGFNTGGLTPVPPPGQQWQGEGAVMHRNMREIARKRMYTLDYLRKAHEGQVFWFNTYMFDRPNQTRMSALQAQRLARRATNYLLLGLSLPNVIDLNSSTPLEFLRSFNALLSEFDSFQQLHGRRTSAADSSLYPADTDGGVNAAATPSSLVNFAGSEAELLPGETYTYLLTPALPFDPDFHETFATLCDALIDCYKRVLSLLPTPREFSTPVAEQFAKVDTKVRKLIIQGAVKEFEENSKMHVKMELANITKVVLGGLM
ncbi:unnamed protein product [Parascedosporium putredinis]|uniref:Uncharacterized protein n=1 Tax=Parascedosporium putredinis TaxID=1442378 RepID=A0A9P1MBE5_9PEZI|nr:unnamed protein product [Parascedosporium putredinis]CAI7995762.1 unnamed protein product [Parascedosporium putredinis]